PLLVGVANRGSSRVVDTWGWDGNNWTQADDVGPGGRSGHAMAFSAPSVGATSCEVLLFGGQNGASTLADTWSWNGEDWTQLSDGGPPPRARHPLPVDPNRRLCV